MPGTTLKTPGGTPTSVRISASRSSESAASSGGLTTIELPAASAGAIFQPATTIGLFHGVIAPTTPSGSRSV